MSHHWLPWIEQDNHNFFLLCWFCFVEFFASNCEHINHELANFKYYYLYPFSSVNYKEDHLITSIINDSYTILKWVTQKMLHMHSRNFLQWTIWLMHLSALTNASKFTPTVKKGRVCNYQEWFSKRLCKNINLIYDFFLIKGCYKYLPENIEPCNECPEGIDVVSKWVMPSKLCHPKTLNYLLRNLVILVCMHQM